MGPLALPSAGLIILMPVPHLQRGNGWSRTARSWNRCGRKPGGQS